METFLKNAESFSNAQETLDNQLAQLKIKQKDALRTELLVEEIFWRMTNQGKAAQIKIQVVKKLFGKVQVKLHAEGTAYNPLVEVSDLGEDDEDYYRMLILKTNRRRLSWIHKQNQNVVTINVSSESNAEAWLTIAGIAVGICLNNLGDKVRPFKEMVSNLNDLFIKMIGLIISFVSTIAFFAMISLVLESNVETVLLISKLIVGQLVICGVMFGVYLLF